MSPHLSLPLRLWPAPHAPASPAAQPHGFSARAPSRLPALAAILGLHVALLWGLLQSRGVQQVLAHAQPLVVMLLSERAAPGAGSVGIPLPMPMPNQPRPLPTPERAPPALQPAPVAVRSEPAPAPSLPAALPSEAAPLRSVSIAPAVPMQPATATQPAAAPAPTATATATDATRQQLPASALQFSEAPVVVYPRLSRRLGESGRVIVRAFVDAAGGAPRSVQLAQSCGHLRLDEAALAAVQKARFRPTVDNGQAVAGWALVPIDFELQAAR